jgi:CheY-like chemotaxis protein
MRNFILIDDDPFNNTISRMAIKKAFGEVDTKIFTVPEEGLAFIQNEYINAFKPTILFLDINMPTLSGWEFMEEFDKLNEGIKKQITVYLLSSSVDQRDNDRAESNGWIEGFISKPLKSASILSAIELIKPSAAGSS